MERAPPWSFAQFLDQANHTRGEERYGSLDELAQIEQTSDGMIVAPLYDGLHHSQGRSSIDLLPLSNKMISDLDMIITNKYF